MARLFGTDGVRGEANRIVTPELAFRLGKAGGYLLAGEGQRSNILIGKDTRISGGCWKLLWWPAFVRWA